MKKIVLTLALALTLASLSAFAHDEGHGPKLTDSPKQGGVVAPVIEAKDAALGKKAAVLHKAELVRLEDGSVRVYLYDKEMNMLPLASFDQAAKGIIEVLKKKKVSKTPFELKQEGDAFVGKAPKPGSKPFNIDVTFQEGGKSLLVAFDNLD
ncbi:MAG: hypothetical protein NDJ89_12945 [Oligoflexia bacterium]|nr:hypothetical protein [Oligoflexia bacterium]